MTPTWHFSYAYNRSGTDALPQNPDSVSSLGLGVVASTVAPDGSVPSISESKVKAPSEMFAISDSRAWKDPDPLVWQGWDWMQYGLFYAPDELKNPRHGKAYNVLFCDGHVALISRLDFIDPRRTARNWNSDNEPHPETWVVQKYP